MLNFLLACLLIMPWVFIPSSNIIDQMRLPQSIFLDFIFMGLISWGFCKGQKYLYCNKYLAYLAGYIFISLFTHFFISYGLETRQAGRIINLWSIEPMLHIILGLGAIQAILGNFNIDDYIKIAKTLCISAVLVASFGIMQYLGFNPFGSINTQYSSTNIVSACLDNSNLVGNYLVLIFPLFFIFIKDLKYLVGVAIVGLGILATACHLAIFLMFLSLLIYAFVVFRTNKLIVGLLIASFLVFITYLVSIDYLKTSNGLSGRLVIWQVAIEKFKLNPIFGHGLGIWKTYQVKYLNTIWSTVHNDWLERLVELGLIGISLITLVIVNTFKRINWKEPVVYSFITSFIVFLLICFGSFPFETATIAFPGILIWAAIEKL